ncbi:MAG TPA: response regulator [Bacteroidia bacterium]|jgi:DNA-binding LytR/AlgR family response regulator|nr:response regulator [Bacteroidia bacterium]
MEKGIKILIVEDEIITATTLQQSLEKAGYDVAGIADEAEVAMRFLKDANPDLVILDIKIMGEKDGIWIAEQINEKYKLPFIFLTSFGDKITVTRAVRTRPYGYLLKPFDKNDILEAVDIALNNFSKSEMAEFPKPNDLHKEALEAMAIKNCIFIRQNNIYSKVNFNDILFIQADKNYVDVIVDAKKYTVRTTLKEMTTNLPKGQFIQINRSCLVNLQKIEGYGREVVIIKQHELTLSDNYKDEFLKCVKTYKD